jgi:hypothetical protein
MSMWSGVKSIFSSSETVNNVLGIAERAGDAAFFTPEEKSAFWIKAMKAYEPFKLLQRVLAILFAVPFILAHMACYAVDFYLIAKGHEPVMELMAQRNIDALGEPVSWIMILYFGGGLIEGGGKAIFKGKK